MNSVRSVGKYAFVIVGAFAVGGILFVASFAILDFVWMHFVATPQTVEPVDGVVVVGGGFLTGCFLGIMGLVWFLYKFWPRKSSAI